MIYLVAYFFPDVQSTPLRRAIELAFSADTARDIDSVADVSRWHPRRCHYSGECTADRAGQSPKLRSIFWRLRRVDIARTRSRKLIAFSSARYCAPPPLSNRPSFCAD